MRLGAMRLGAMRLGAMRLGAHCLGFWLGVWGRVGAWGDRASIEERCE